MTKPALSTENQRLIAKAIASGTRYSGGGAAVAGRIDDYFSVTRPTEEVIREVSREVALEDTGVVSDTTEIKRLLSLGFRICNYAPGQVSIHYPDASGGGLYRYVVGEMADELGRQYDAHNYAVVQMRRPNACSGSSR